MKSPVDSVGDEFIVKFANDFNSLPEYLCVRHVLSYLSEGVESESSENISSE